MRKLILIWNVAVLPVALFLIWRGHWLQSFLLLGTAHWPWLYATLMPACSWWGPLFSRLPAAEGADVWLTIDDGPDPEDTPRLLDLLDAHGAKATFFVIGRKARQHPDLIREMVRRGHEIGNHTQTHPSGVFWAFGPRAQEVEVAECSAAIRAAAPDARLRWFRAPAGLRNHWLHPVLDRAGLKLAGWSARGFDGVQTDQNRIVARLVRGIQPGAVLLIHEGRRTSDGARLASLVLEPLLGELARRGCRCVLPE